MHTLDIFHGPGISLAWSGVSVAYVALHVTFVDYVEERETWVVLVLGTYAAIERASVEYGGEAAFRKVRPFQIVVTQPKVGIIGRNECPRIATVRAKLAEPYFVSPSDEMGWNKSIEMVARVAERFGHSEEEVVFF